MKNKIDIADQIEEWAGEKIKSRSSVSGGCIANSEVLTLKSGEQVFLKTGNAVSQMYYCEANGLKELKKANVIKIPEVYLVNDDFLLIEHVNQGSRDSRFFETFGHQFAEMHRITSSNFGFFEDNFIGATPQINTSNGVSRYNWSEFYFQNRLLYQFQLAEQNGYATTELRRGIEHIKQVIDTLLEPVHEPPTLLHGDLWSGNFMIGANSIPVIIDPAVYYGNREADLAMTKLFGGFETRFYDAYYESYPLPDGYRERENLYILYHVLNHLNLFGQGYYHQALSLIESYY